MRKLFKVIGYILLTFLIITLLAISYFFINNRLYLGSADEAFVRYLDHNKSTVEANFDGALFDDSFFKSDIFLLGEIHGYADNQQLDQNLFCFLNKNLGITDYLAEIDSLTADSLNQYLSNKHRDDELLKRVVLRVKKSIPQQAGQELYNKWAALYAYNQRLPDTAKIRVWGVDKALSDTSRDISRDSAMFLNTQKILISASNKGKKFYGFFGYFHVLQSTPMDRTAPFATRLVRSGLQVTSLVSHALESEMYMPKGYGFPTPENETVDIMNADGPLMLVSGINDAKAASTTNSTTLFKLNAKGSPYGQSAKLLSMKTNFFDEPILPNSRDSVTTDYFQYLFLLRNSKAIRPLQ